ncbi:hypothetical protein [Pectinatus frisingensis]|uniref:hypothetical protein n=1 Tax=Pectinatus frisingensis TaxID=865 RepID=UPI003D8004CB
MSKIIKVVFVKGDSLFSKVIEKVEQLGEDLHGNNNVDFVPSHCGLIVDDQFREALIDGFVGENVRRYDPTNIRIYDVTINDDAAIAAGDTKFNKLLGQKYSISALVCGATYTIFSMIIGNTPNQDDCSGDDTEILRAYGLDINNKDADGNDVPASSITPNILIGIIAKIGTLEGA